MVPRNFGNVEVIVAFQNSPKFYRHFDNIDEFSLLPKFSLNHDNNNY
jgi:hypothetical protein